MKAVTSACDKAASNDSAEAVFLAMEADVILKSHAENAKGGCHFETACSFQTLYAVMELKPPAVLPPPTYVTQVPLPRHSLSPSFTLSTLGRRNGSVVVASPREHPSIVLGVSVTAPPQPPSAGRVDDHLEEPLPPLSPVNIKAG